MDRLNKRNAGISVAALVLFVVIFGLIPTLVIGAAGIGLTQLPLLNKPQPLTGPAFDQLGRY